MTEYMENKKNTRRLALFVCYDKDGIIDDYIPYLLRDLIENLEMLVVVVNGALTPEGHSTLEKFTPHIVVRENQGVDAAAWKEAMIDYLGWEKLDEFDELVLLNDSFFGPLYPFRKVFEEMDRRPVDFWGLTAHAAIDDPVLSRFCPYNYLPAHIQSYFIAIRKKMFSSHAFRSYWETQPLFKSREEAIGQNEAVFTKHFEDAGFTWDVFCDTSDLDGEFLDGSAVNHHIVNIYELLANRKCPIIKRAAFGAPYIHHLNYSNGQQLKKSLDYVIHHTDYSIALIYKNILRTYNITDIFNNLHIIFPLPQKRNKPVKIKGKSVFIFFIFYNEFDYLKQYICEIPEFVDVILVTKPESNLNAVRQYFLPILKNRLRVISARDPGRDLSALLVAAREYLNDYDYIGFCHDKKSSHAGPVTSGKSFQELIIENTIASEAYVENVLELFEHHPELGFLSPPPPRHSGFFGNFVTRYWGSGCVVQTRTLARRLGLSVDISEAKMPLSLGTAFWCKRDAMAPLFDYPWTYEDFPPEPLPIDATLNHALERIFPYVAQHQGYLSGWVMTEDYASLEICTVQCQLDQLLHSDSDNPGLIQNTMVTMKEQAEARAARLHEAYVTETKRREAAEKCAEKFFVAYETEAKRAAEFHEAYVAETRQREAETKHAAEFHEAYMAEARQREAEAKRASELNEAYLTETARREQAERRAAEYHEAYLTEARLREELEQSMWRNRLRTFLKRILRREDR